MKVRGTSEVMCACGNEPCRPGQRTGLQCHAEAMRKSRQTARPTFERMQWIWALVLGGTYPNATTLARCLETSTKSVHRDIQFMRDRLHFDIRYDGTRFGYYTTQGPNCCPFCHPSAEVSAKLGGFQTALGEAEVIHENLPKTPIHKSRYR